MGRPLFVDTPAPEPRMHRCPRKMEKGEVWDCIQGKFLEPGEQSKGTIRYVVQAKKECDFCHREIQIGEEVEEDFARACSLCCDKIDSEGVN